ncbi:MAG: hypothetical protein BGO55_26045 [Sphingobacteriales bacterium 50-39]|nr:MAG: hypothetical protein BGO55_26045 [Sphingobacteriales bacterium 50-39]
MQTDTDTKAGTTTSATAGAGGDADGKRSAERGQTAESGYNSTNNITYVDAVTSTTLDLLQGRTF